MFQVNLVAGAYGLDDDAGFFHGRQYAKKSKTGRCYFQIRRYGRNMPSFVSPQFYPGPALRTPYPGHCLSLISELADLLLLTGGEGRNHLPVISCIEGQGLKFDGGRWKSWRRHILNMPPEPVDS